MDLASSRTPFAFRVSFVEIAVPFRSIYFR
jgi:hypothetical protein